MYKRQKVASSTIPRSDLLALISAKNGSPPAGTSSSEEDGGGGGGALAAGLRFLESKLNAGTGGGGGA